jgi:hypothetical protein
MGGALARMWAKRNAYRILMGKQEGKRPPGRPRRRWVDNIKMDLREIGWDGIDWMEWIGWIWLRIWTSRSYSFFYTRNRLYQRFVQPFVALTTAVYLSTDSTYT